MKTNNCGNENLFWKNVSVGSQCHEFHVGTMSLATTSTILFKYQILCSLFVGILLVLYQPNQKKTWLVYFGIKYDKDNDDNDEDDNIKA
jgi:hypothetical protein